MHGPRVATANEAIRSATTSANATRCRQAVSRSSARPYRLRIFIGRRRRLEVSTRPRLATKAPTIYLNAFQDGRGTDSRKFALAPRVPSDRARGRGSAGGLRDALEGPPRCQKVTALSPNRSTRRLRAERPIAALSDRSARLGCSAHGVGLTGSPPFTVTRRIGEIAFRMAAARPGVRLPLDGAIKSAFEPGRGRRWRLGAPLASLEPARHGHAQPLLGRHALCHSPRRPPRLWCRGLRSPRYVPARRAARVDLLQALRED